MVGWVATALMVAALVAPAAVASPGTGTGVASPGTRTAVASPGTGTGVASPSTGGAAPTAAPSPGPPPDPNAVSVVITDPAAHLWLAAQPSLELTASAPPSTVQTITVQDSTALQTVDGFGAAMTDSSAWLIEHFLSPSARAALMTQLFGSSGIHLDFLRVPIGASDYTATGTPYSYDDLPAGKTDPTLQRFSIRHDQAYVLPALRQVLRVDSDTQLLASPWTAPAWMKGNDSLDNVGNKGTLRGRYYGAWARYIVKFLQAYAAAGVRVDAITPQNEPGNPTPYPGMDMSVNSLANWTVRDLAPALKAAHLNTRIYGLDFGWGSARLAHQLTAGETAEFSGVAWHCYFGSPNVMETLHIELPAVSQIVDECAPGITPFSTSEIVISSLRDWASSVAVWNLALNPQGGPVQQPNKGCPGCHGLVTVVPRLRQVWPSKDYYELGQASSAIEPGARVVASNNFVTYNYLKPGVNFISPSVDDVAAVNPNGTRVLLAYNNGVAPAAVAVAWHGESFTYTLPAGATVTFTWNR